MFGFIDISMSKSITLRSCVNKDQQFAAADAFRLVDLSLSLLSPNQVLQQAGRNPTHASLRKYWTPTTSALTFDDFCEILKSEKGTEESELLRAFRKMDVNGDGYVSHGELEKALTTVSLL